jgi:hypothetical protein
MGTGDVGGQKHLERGLEASLRRRKEHFSKVIGGEPILRKGLWEVLPHVAVEITGKVAMQRLVYHDCTA